MEADAPSAPVRTNSGTWSRTSAPVNRFVHCRDQAAAASSSTTAPSFTSRMRPYDVPVRAFQEPRPRQDW